MITCEAVRAKCQELKEQTGVEINRTTYRQIAYQIHAPVPPQYRGVSEAERDAIVALPEWQEWDRASAMFRDSEDWTDMVINAVMIQQRNAATNRLVAQLRGEYH